MSAFSLTNPPLICVVARVQFTPLAKIADYIPDLQEALRLEGYPHFEEQKTKAWHIADLAEAGMNVSCQDQSRWDFSNLNRAVTLRVDRESLTLLFTDYDHFANAEPQYQAILSMVEKTIPALTPQVMQLRYISYIPYDETSSPTDWVVSSVLGVPNIGPLQRESSFSETRFLTPEGGRFVVRCMSFGPNHLTLPPDLLPLNVQLKYPLQSKTAFLMLENVHQQKAVAPVFTAETCLAELAALRPYNIEVFQKTVTPKALEVWK
jgi:uncharacterized protein (TIGR04255 family)